MARNLRQRLKAWGIGVGLVGLAGILAGCATMSPEERQAVGLLGGLMSIHPDATPSEAGLGALIRDEAVRIDEQEARMREAREGRSEVNVNIYGSESSGNNYEALILNNNKEKQKIYEKIVGVNWNKKELWVERDNSIVRIPYIQILEIGKFPPRIQE